MRREVACQDLSDVESIARSTRLSRDTVIHEQQDMTLIERMTEALCQGTDHT